MTTAGFVRREPDRTIRFGRGSVESSPELRRGGFTLLGSDRSLALPEAPLSVANATVRVPPGQVDELAAGLLGQVPAQGPLVAFGGGRVIDTAKAVAAAGGGRAVVAVPTTLSGAEMNGIHRHARGLAPDTARVRPAAVINDPALSASLPVDRLAASSANALAHAVAAATAAEADGVVLAVAGDAAARIAAAWQGREPDRAALALGALLAGWALDQSGLGIHHALAQTAVRRESLAHAETNAVLLPHTVRALRSRQAARLDRLDLLIGQPVEEVAGGLARRSPAAGLERVVAEPARLGRLVEAASRRPEAQAGPAPFEPAGIEAIYRAAAVPVRESAGSTIAGG